jgi:hypothetical protein
VGANWADVRYRGDARDVEELFNTYRINDYLEAFEENRRQRDRGIREKLIKEGIRLTDRLSPRIYRIFQGVCDALGFKRRPRSSACRLPTSTPSPSSTSARRPRIRLSASRLARSRSSKMRSCGRFSGTSSGTSCSGTTGWRR